MPTLGSITFDELLDVAKGLEGKTIEVSVQVAAFEADREPHSLVSFGGVVERVKIGRGSRSIDRRPWRIWLTGDSGGQSGACVTLDPRLYIDGAFDADREEADDAFGERGEEPRAGMTWTLRVRQAGVMTEILVYV